MTRTMYDSVSAASIPADATMVAGYLNGAYAWSSEDWARFPHAVHVTVTVNTSAAADVLDVENGDASPAEAPGWIATHPGGSIYCDSSTWPAVKAAFGGRPLPPFWIADYNGDASTIPTGAVAAQYEDAGPYDLSVCADYWPGVDPLPEDDMPLNAADEAAIRSIVTAAITANRPVAVADTLYWLAAGVTGQPPAGGVAPVDLHSIAELHAALVAGPSAQLAALSARLVAAEAALAAVEKGELTAAEVQAAVAAALAAAGHVAA